MDLDLNSIDRILATYKFKNTKQTAKATTYKKQNDYIYILPNKILTIIISPEVVESISYLKANNEGLYHSTAMIEFPKRQNKGKREIHYGYKFIIEDLESLKNILTLL